MEEDILTNADGESPRNREIALFGGAFNPPHVGHVYVASHVLATEDVDELWLVPTFAHAFGKSLAPFEARMNMCREVASLFGERVRATAVERELAEAGRPSFTIDTLDHLLANHPESDFALVIGSDNLSSLDRWKDAERLRSLARLIVINRSGHPLEGTGPAIPDVSSTWIRERLRLGRSVRGWVPMRVAEECEQGGWYR